jgi:hypothetical protein
MGISHASPDRIALENGCLMSIYAMLVKCLILHVLNLEATVRSSAMIGISCRV